MKVDAIQYKDRIAFLNPLKGLLYLYAEKKITPRQALRHSFVKTAPQADDMDTSSHADAAPWTAQMNQHDSVTYSEANIESKGDRPSAGTESCDRVADSATSSEHELGALRLYYDGLAAALHIHVPVKIG